MKIDMWSSNTETFTSVFDRYLRICISQSKQLSNSKARRIVCLTKDETKELYSFLKEMFENDT